MTVRVRYLDLATEWFPLPALLPRGASRAHRRHTLELTEVQHADQVNYLAVLARQSR